jgi:hypothetical protein
MPISTSEIGNVKAYNDSNTFASAINSQDARIALKAMLADFGFDADQVNNLTSQFVNWNAQNYSGSTILNSLLPTSNEYKQRFIGNEARVKNGLPALSPAQYLSNEESYRSALKSAGVPKGFYDSKSAIDNLISNDVSPTEFNARLGLARKALDNTDPYYKQALQSMYGLDDGHMIAHLLDPEAAAPLVERQAKAVEYGAAAARQGLALGPTSQYEAYASGVGTGTGAEQGMAQIAAMTPGLTTLAQISNDQYNQGTAEQEVFGGLASAQRKREQLTQQEVGRFTGRSNVASGSLNADNTGQF